MYILRKTFLYNKVSMKRSQAYITVISMYCWHQSMMCASEIHVVIINRRDFKQGCNAITALRHVEITLRYRCTHTLVSSSGCPSSSKVALIHVCTSAMGLLYDLISAIVLWFNVITWNGGEKHVSG